MKLINIITGDVRDVQDYQAGQWIASCTPWMSKQAFDEKGMKISTTRVASSQNPVPNIQLPSLKVELENCYGIKKLENEFTFTEGSSYSIYAPNGFMKTSFAKAFLDLQKGNESKDLIYLARETKRVIEDGDGNPLNPDSVFVIEPYVENYTSNKASTLLVNSELKKNYEETLKRVDSDLKDVLNKLKQLSGLTGRLKTPETEILSIFGNNTNIYEFFDTIHDQLDGDIGFSDITYAEVFTEKTITLLKSGAIKAQIKEYIEKYQELVDSSPVLNRKFNHSGATDVSKSLSSNGFFDANHSININDGKDKKEISSSKDLDEILSTEKEKILGDENLTKKFEAVDSKLKNAELRKFREYLQDHQEILPELENFDVFRTKLWKSYFNTIKDLIEAYSATYSKSKKIITEISAKAEEEKTRWESVVELFNRRFYVPFTLSVENQKDVILKGEALNVVFDFDDGNGDDPRRVGRESLIEVLSQGERRALYILNILFEVNARVELNQATLFIVDDIADSFDYKNKYAIVEYFKELSSIHGFRFIFLTHNFDFHRTVCGRINIPGRQRLFCSKNDVSIELSNDRYQSNPFKSWKGKLETDKSALIAAIPFVRNLAEYSSGTGSCNYLKLTSLLHQKADTNSITIGDLESVLKSILTDKSGLSLDSKNSKVVEIILDEAKLISNSPIESVELENKVVLSIAIRLLAERYMIEKIDDSDFLSSIDSNQTFKLFEMFSSTFPGESNSLEILSQVNLMTPENIHLNSFMYEPILDMSANHLYDLYGSVCTLNN